MRGGPVVEEEAVPSGDTAWHRVECPNDGTPSS
jgi:hypothetical protein